MKDKNQYLLRKICKLYIFLTPVYFLLTLGFNSVIVFMLSLLMLVVLAGFNYEMSKIENVNALNVVYGILYFIAFAVLFSSFVGNYFNEEEIGVFIILILSIICPSFVYWYLKTRENVIISIFIISFNFLIIVCPIFLLILVNIVYG